jgi:purine nucleoside permease
MVPMCDVTRGIGKSYVNDSVIQLLWNNRFNLSLDEREALEEGAKT